MLSQAHKKWYAIRVRPRQEKKVKKLLDLKSIENYLPLKEEMRQWSDRKRKIETPVVSGYLFVKIDINERENVYLTDGFSSFINEKGSAVVIPDDQIERLRFMVKKSNGEVEFSEMKITTGDKIRIVKGELEGLIGILRESQGKYKVVIQIDGLGCAKASVPLSYVERID